MPSSFLVVVFFLGSGLRCTHPEPPDPVRYCRRAWPRGSSSSTSHRQRRLGTGSGDPHMPGE
ncbi:hypothetical protein E2562_025063 [Oryza meyeriana var. granulata]|uniref:Uncharacterized protein n=1 Tax=Oryza meyeriana var. granulata TaxID=110450 RepID=A0A6G1D7N4_9ORYZ|nr:hypothetical protein E2562_025063 [Oryza meyeriana var. granulata]